MRCDSGQYAGQAICFHAGLRDAAGALESIRSKATKANQATTSNGKLADSIIETLIDLKIYIGAGAGTLILLIGLIIASFRRRKKISVQTANFN